MMPTKIIFFGSSEFALPALQKLIKNNYPISLIITKADEPAGRNKKLTATPVKLFCLENNLEFIQPEKLKNQEIIDKIKNINAITGVVASYGKIIPQEIIDLFPIGLINLHPSLLPKYRGPSPIQTAILNGDDVTGVSIIKLDKEMDHGPVISQSQFVIRDSNNTQALLIDLSENAAKLLVEILPDYLNGKIIPQAQNDNNETFTKMITKEDGLIDFTKSAVEIERQIRAFYPWPGSYADFVIKDKKIRIKIISARIVDDLSSAIGLLQQKNGQLFVQFKSGALEILKLQPEGKNEMLAKDFINGYFKSDSTPAR